MNQETKAKFVSVTKKFVDNLLAKNECNRPISRSQVEMELRDIQNGRWIFNGETIKVDGNGCLLDGQHRLMAIKEAGYPSDIKLLVVYFSATGDDRKRLFHALNGGRTAPAAQIFTAEGIPDGRNKYSVAKKIGQVYYGVGITNKVSSEEALEVYELFKSEIEEMIELKNKKPPVRFLSAVLAAFAIAAHSRPNSSAVRNFAYKVAFGEGLQKGTIEYAFFKYCASLKTGHMNTMFLNEQFVNALYAIYYYLDNPHKPITKIRVTADARSKLLERALADAQSK